ncbi:MAG: hypothetical protein AAF488_01485 [Planctomycetota bacterium]
MAKAVDYNATLVGREDLTDALTIFRFRFDAPPPETPWFVPGQYCVIGLNNEESPELGPSQRPMSIASAPQDNEIIEFYIRYVAHPTSQNPLTHLLWKLAEGDRAFVRPAPKGRFTITHLVGDEDARTKLMVAAGTGLAPFVSIVRDHQRREPHATLSKYAILHGASYPEDLGYREELETLSTDHGLRYLPTVSRAKERPSWSGMAGRVEDLFLPERLEEVENRLGLASGSIVPSEVAIFVCGLQGTIGRCIERLAPRGFVPEHRGMRKALSVPEDVESSFFYEQYDTEPVIDLTDEALVADLSEQLQAGIARADG